MRNTLAYFAQKWIYAKNIIKSQIQVVFSSKISVGPISNFQLINRFLTGKENQQKLESKL
jgi:hypothetical protein